MFKVHVVWLFFYKFGLNLQVWDISSGLLNFLGDKKKCTSIPDIVQEIAFTKWEIPWLPGCNNKLKENILLIYVQIIEFALIN